MTRELATTIRTQLLDRRRRLKSALAEVGTAEDFVQLLGAVDAALGRLDSNEFGQCDVCHTAVEDQHLLANPLIQYCLCDLSPQQQAALQHDLSLARRVQLALLPKQDLAHAGWEVHFRYQPAGPVSGDYLDVVPCDGNGDAATLYLMLGDVSGKGVAASLLMARLNALLRALVEGQPHPGALVDRTNSIFRESTIASHFATLVCARAGQSGSLEVCNAGHCPPLVSRRDGVEALGTGGLPVGLSESGGYEVHTAALDPGDTLLLYSDGITEAFNPAHDQFGSDRLSGLLLENRTMRPAALAARCLADVAEFRAGAAMHDDISIMVVRRT